MSSKEKKVNNSIYWYVVLPICVLILLGFFIYVLFSLSSVQLIGTERVHALIKKMPHNIR
jgi:hypothetical protein